MRDLEEEALQRELGRGLIGPSELDSWQQRSLETGPPAARRFPPSPALTDLGGLPSHQNGPALEQTN